MADAAAYKCPPYAKRFSDVLDTPGVWPQYRGTSSDGKRLSLFIIAGSNAWEMAKKSLSSKLLFLVHPPADPPEIYDWRICAGHEPIIILTAGRLNNDISRRLSIALLRDGVDRVVTSAGDGYGQRYIARRDK